MKKKIIIFGTGGIAKIAHYYFMNDSEYEVIAFTVDSEFKESDTFCKLPVVPFEEVQGLYSPGDYQAFVALGYANMNELRAYKYSEVKSKGYKLVSYISSRCNIFTDEQIGENCFILEGNNIQPFVKIGNNVTLWSGNHIGHDSVIEDHCFVSTHAVISGNVNIGSHSFVGVNATIRNGINIAPKSLIGPGALVLNDTVGDGAYLQQRAKLSSEKSNSINL